ncbi:prion protein b isoform X2 [Toxotes jaculatrix]|uniref:prion protein b isoform X2 n=1 Tax=Toxotes jaculatrix TaxID=941984 RepID=UPI001B3AA1BA|nr:prion protein b isoform X2 [Toxotes jaculatrix]
MKPTVIAVLCLSLLLNINFSLAKKRIGLFKKTPKIKTNLDTKSKSTQQFNQGGYPQQPGSAGGYSNPGGYPQQPGSAGGYSNQGGYPQQPGRAGGYFNQGGYPQQPGSAGGYFNQGGYPQHPGRAGGYSNQGGYPQQPSYPAGGYPAGGYPAQGYQYGGGYGSYGGYGGYPGGYVNYNPNNKILSPHYGGSFGYGGYGARGGSPFSQSVQEMGVYPQDKSRGFGRSAVMAAAGGAVAGMALGYGLGRFPRPHFHFHSPQEEYYYNHYMYRKYGVKSSDENDYGRDYVYSQPLKNYDNYMDECMKRTDLLPAENRNPQNKPAATTTATTTTTTSTATTSTPAPEMGIGTNTTKTNSTSPENSSTSAPSTPHSVNESKANPEPPASQAVRTDATDDDDTVSIVEIGYPALIRQLKVKRCMELYMVYSERYLKKKTEPRTSNGVERLDMGLQGLLAAVISTILMLLNSNMLMLLH